MKLLYTVAAFSAVMMMTSDAIGQTAVKQVSPALAAARAAKASGAHGSYMASDAARGGGLANDECAGAVEITPGATCTPTNVDMTGATESMPANACSGFTADAANDVWFWFEAAYPGTIVEASGLGVEDGVDPILEVFSGSCGDLTSLGCIDGTLVGGTEMMSLPTTVGETYYVRVYYWPYEEAPASFGLSICVYSAPDAPENDGCSSTPEALAIGTPLSFSGTTAGATNAGDFQDGSVLEGEAPTVWHSFTTTECANVTISYCGIAPAFETFWIFLAPSCPAGDDYILASSSEFISCGDGNGTMTYEGLPVGTYNLPVQYDAAVANGAYTLTVTASACAAVPANDECEGAISLPVGASCVTTAGTNDGASESMAPATCSDFTSTAAIDVWYSFVAPSAEVDVIATSAMDMVMEIFSGGCGSLTSLTCIDAGTGGETLNMTDLTPFSTYYVRVYGWAGATEPFDICVVNNGPIGIDENGAGAFTIFPNPTNGDITINGGTITGNVMFEMTDMTGRVVYNHNELMGNGQLVTLPIAGKVAAGMYTLSLTNNGARSVRSVVVR